MERVQLGLYTLYLLLRVRRVLLPEELVRKRITVLTSLLSFCQSVVHRVM